MSLRTVRVYGFLEDDQGRVLVSAERFRGMPLVKYPGGGVEWGEGLREALAREFQEELGLEISSGDLVFFNEFPVISAFDSKYQVFSFFLPSDRPRSLRLCYLGRAGGSRERRRTTGLGTQVGTHEGSLYP